MTRIERRSRAPRAFALVSALVLTVSCGSGGASEPTEPTIPADASAIVAASAQAMGDTTSVRFELQRAGAPIYIDQFGSLALNSAVGQFRVPRSAQAVLEVQVDGSLTTELGAVALDDEIWLSNPVTGNFETLPDAYDIDPSLFFDPEDGWRPLMENLVDVELVAATPVDRDGDARYHIRATAPADRVEVITARLVRGQDVDIDFWIQPVTGHVRAAEFSTPSDEGVIEWTLLLDDYGASFDISPPEGVES